MRKSIKKILSVFLTFALILPTCPVYAADENTNTNLAVGNTEVSIATNAESESTETFTDDDIVDWRYSTSERGLYSNDLSKENMLKIFQGETAAEILSMYRDKSIEMPELKEFFKYSVFKGITEEMLVSMYVRNITFDYLKDKMLEYMDKEPNQPMWSWLDDVIKDNYPLQSSAYEADDYSIETDVITGEPYKTGDGEGGDEFNISHYDSSSVHTINASVIGIPSLTYAPLTINGKAAFCARANTDLDPHSNYNAISVPGTSREYVVQALKYYADYPSSSARDYAQLWIWAGDYNEDDIENIFNELCKARFGNADYSDIAYEIASYDTNSGDVIYYYTPQTTGYQELWSISPPKFKPEWAIDAYAKAWGKGGARPKFLQRVSLRKISSVNDNSLAGAKFKISITNKNGAYYSEEFGSESQIVSTDVNGNATANFGRFFMPRITSPEQNSTNSSHGVTVAWIEGDVSESEARAQARTLAQNEMDGAVSEVKTLINNWLENKEAEVVSSTSISYKIEETEAPNGHNISFSPMNLTITGSGYGTANSGNLGDITNVPWRSKIDIKKVDSQQGQTIDNAAEFTLYEWDSSQNNYIVSPNFAMTRLADKSYSVHCINPGLSNVESGYLYWTTSNQGRFRVVETKAPQDFYGDFENYPDKKHNYDIQLSKSLDGQTLHLTALGFATTDGKFANVPATGTLKFFKVDADTNTYIEHNGDASLNGAVYDVYVKDDILSYDKNGLAVYDGKECKKDTVIATGTITNGSFIINNLPIGNYYVKERVKENTPAGKLSFAPGYLVDENTYEVSIQYSNENALVEVVTSSLDKDSYPSNYHKTVNDAATISKDQVIKSSMKLTKLTQKTGETEMRVLAGAGFSIYRINDLSKIADFTKTNTGKWNVNSIIAAYENKTYDNLHPKFDFSAEKKASMYSGSGTAVEFPEVFSDNNGIVEITNIPYGQYLVVETTTPPDVFTVDPFILDINENSATNTNMRYLDDEGFEAYLKIVKIDAETGKEVQVPNVEFEIYKDTGEKVVMTDTIIGFLPRTIDVFKTNNEGIITLPELLPTGDYIIKEKTAPKGYYNRTTVDGYSLPFKVTTERVYQAVGTDLSVNRDVIKISENFENHETLGQLTIQKTGEILTGFKEDSGFEYTKVPIAGAVFEVRAKDTIKAPDMQTIWYEKDALVATIDTGGESTIVQPKNAIYEFLTLTNENGKATITLPLGEYNITEVKAPIGYALDSTPNAVSLKWENQDKKYVVGDASINDERQMCSLTLRKGDADDTSVPVSGAMYGLYADEDIMDHAGKLLVAKDTRIAGGVTDSDGCIYFDLGLPFGKYYAKEEAAPPGYLINPDKLPIVFEYQTDGRALTNLKIDTSDEKSGIKIRKTDYKGKVIKDATLAIYNSSDLLLAEWVTSDKDEVVPNLPLNTTLYLKELSPAPGYVSAEPIEFSIIQAENNVALSNPQDEENPRLLIMKDDHTKLEISKKDITNKGELAGAKLSITNEKGKTLYTWISGSDGTDSEGNLNPHLIEYLPIGKYTLKEIQAPDGYEIAEEIEFEVTDTGVVQSCEMFDSPAGGIIKLLKVDAVDESITLQGAEFIVYEGDKQVAKIVTDKNGVGMSPKLARTMSTPYGNVYNNYRVVETKVPNGYVPVNGLDFAVSFDPKFKEVSTEDGTVVYDIGKVPNIKKTLTSGGILTGDNTPLGALIIIILLSGLILITIFTYKKRLH